MRLRTPARRAATSVAALLVTVGGLAACGSDDGDDDGARPVPQLPGRPFDDPADDVEQTSGSEPPPDGLGDVRRAAIDVDGGVLSVTVALQDVGEASEPGGRATRYDVSLGGFFTSDRSTFEELAIHGSANDQGVARASVSISNQNLETSRDLCRGRAAYAASRALVRDEVALSCLPGGKLDVGSPTLTVDVAGRRFRGTDTVDLGVRRLTAG